MPDIDDVTKPAATAEAANAHAFRLHLLIDQLTDAASQIFALLWRHCSFAFTLTDLHCRYF